MGNLDIRCKIAEVNFGKSGRRFYPCGVLVDATGDASIMKQAGVPTTDGENFFTYYGEGITLGGCRAAVEKKNIFLAYYHPYGGAANLHGQFQPEGKSPYVGCDVEYFVKNCKMPVFCFTPDAEFPVCNGEKGIFRMKLH